MKIKLVLLTIVLTTSLTGCESNDNHVLMRVTAFALGGLIISRFVRKRNDARIQKDGEIVDNFRKLKEQKKQNQKKFSDQTSGDLIIDQSDDKEKHSYNESSNSDAIETINDIPVGIYGYRKGNNLFRNLIIFNAIIFIGGFALDSIVLYAIGFGLLVTITIVKVQTHFESEPLPYNNTYKLFNDRLECYINETAQPIVIQLAEIEKIETDYKYTTGRGGEEIDRIYYNLKNKNGNTMHKMEVQWLHNFDTHKSFRDEFSQFIKSPL